jgi:hypothetical protein
MKLKSLLICAFALLSFSARSQTCASLPTNLVSWWRAETNALDSLRSHHGTLFNGASYATGKVGQAFSFDGVDDFVSVPHTDDFSPTGPFSVEVWIKASASQPESLFHIMDTQTSSDRTGWFVIGNGAGKVYIGFGNATAFPAAVSTTGVKDDQWHHLVGVFNGTQLQMYVDGVLEGTIAAGNPPLNETGELVIGRGWGDGFPYRHFRGLVDEPSYYSRALSSNEVFVLHAAGGSGKCTDKPLFITDSLPDALVGSPYLQTLQAGLTPGPYAFAVTSGSLPAGLTLSSNGVVSGTATTVGTNTFTIQITDSLLQTAQREFTLAVLACTAISDGIVAWWRAEANALDSLRISEGTLVNNPTYVAGKVGMAFSFNGNNAIEVPHAAAFSYASNTPMSIELWAFRTSGANGQHLLGKRPGCGSEINYQFFFDGSALSWQSVVVAGALPLNTWTHFIGTFDGTNFSLFVNGQMAGSAPGSMGPENTAPLTLGRSGTCGGFGGLLDEVTFYNRALTANEAAALFAADKGGKSREQLLFAARDLPVGVVGRPYLQRLAVGVTPEPYAYEIVGGALPAGLELFGDGTIEGTPITVGTSNPRVRVTDSYGNLVEKDLPLQISGGLAPLNPIGWWRAEADALDNTGAHHGTLLGATGFVPGAVGQAFSFNGGSATVQVTNWDAFSYEPDEPMTAEFWVYRTSNSNGRTLLGKGFCGVMNYGFFQNGSTLDWWGCFGGSVPGSAWTHVAGTFDGTNRILYINGQVAGTSTNTFGPTNSTALIFGGSPACAGFVGALDEITFYDRALSAAEVNLSRDYPLGKGLFITSLSPLPAGGEGAEYAQTLLATNGTPPYSFAVIEGTLPDGLSIVGGNGLGGIPNTYGSNRFTLRVTDSIGRVADRKFGLKIFARPVLPPRPDLVIDELTSVSVTNTATDADVPAQNLAYTLLSAPPGATISTNGIISWTTTEIEGPGTNVFTTKVTDDGPVSLSATNTFSIVVNEVNLSPELTVPADATIDELAAYSANATATDSDLPANTLTFHLVSGPSGLTISPAGAMNWTPGEGQGPGMHPVSVRVFDNGTPSLSHTQSFTLTVNEVNVAPILTVPPSSTNDELVAYSATATATDADLPANTLTFELVSCPSGLTVSPAGAINWTPGDGQGPGVHPVSVRVFDNGTPSLSHTQSFTLTVNEVNVAPVLTVPPSSTNDELVAYSANATATDSDLPANTLTFELVSGPGGVAVSSGGAINWTPTEAQGPGVYPVSVRVLDNGTPSLSHTQSFTLTVNEVNVAPALTLPADATNDELVAYSADATATDSDLPANTLTFELLSGPNGLTVSSAGAINWTPTEAQGPGGYPISVRVFDNGSPSLSQTQTFTLTVNEVNLAPQLGPLGDYTVNSGQTISFSASATDPDLPANAVAFSLVNPPAGASIDANSGAFTWRPSVTLANTTNTVSVRVVDDGVPPLSSTRSFNVTVQPLGPVVLMPLTFASGAFRFSVMGGVGPDYVLQRSLDLSNWMSFLTNTPTSLPFSVTDTSGASSNQFYRALIGP